MCRFACADRTAAAPLAHYAAYESQERAAFRSRDQQLQLPSHTPHMRAETAVAFRMCRSHERANRRRSSAIGSLLHPADGLQSIGGCQQTDDAAFRSRDQQLQPPSRPVSSLFTPKLHIAIFRRPLLESESGSDDEEQGQGAGAGAGASVRAVLTAGRLAESGGASSGGGASGVGGSAGDGASFSFLDGPDGERHQAAVAEARRPLGGGGKRGGWRGWCGCSGNALRWLP